MISIKKDMPTVQDIEQEIDEIIYELFDLTPEEIKLIDQQKANIGR